MGSVIFIPNTQSQPVPLYSKNGFIPEMPFRLMWQITKFKLLVRRRQAQSQERIYALNAEYYDPEEGMVTERIFCDLQPKDFVNDRGDCAFMGSLLTKSGTKIEAEAILNLKKCDGYVFA